MMAKTFISSLFILILLGNTAPAQIKNTTDLLKTMHKKFAGKTCRSFTFSQDNKHYKDSLGQTVIRTSTWHEAIQYPDKFRIDFGDPKEGNAVIFRNDSAYHFRKGQLKFSGEDKNDLLLLLGGMYHRKLEELGPRLTDLGFDLSKFSERTSNKNMVYVVGAGINDSLSSQFWVEKKTLRVVRIINKLDEKRNMDIRFFDFKENCGGYTETLVKAWINGKLEQEEKYREVNSQTLIPDNFFDPSAFGKSHWKKP